MESKRLFQAASFAATAAFVFLASDAARATPTHHTVKPDGSGDCMSIQEAIDGAAPGDFIDVYPGTYDETAADRQVLGAGGSYQFGLFIGADKSGITIEGIGVDGHVVGDFKKAAAFVKTNATNNFGYSGIFVEGDHVTISGLNIGSNAAGDEKTLEVIGDDFTLLCCDVSAEQGSVYFGDYRFDEGTNTSHIQSYWIEKNNFRDGVSIDLANGAGFSGALEGRVIKKNKFVTSHYWPAISFNGSDTGVPWFVHSVGGAVIRENSFVNTFAGDADSVHLDTEAHIRARGTYDNDQFRWDHFWADNKFDHAYVVGPHPPRELRTYEYDGAYGTFENVRRIGAIKTAEVAHALPGDKVMSK